MDVLIIDYIICKIHLNTTYNYVEDIFNFVIDSNKSEEKLVTPVLMYLDDKKIKEQQEGFVESTYTVMRK
jgi:hypothetical protein